MKISGMRVLHLGDIDEKSAKELERRLRKKPGVQHSHSVLLLINSNGGDIESGFKICEAIRENGKVIGLVVGSCGSMAVPILQACCYRLALPQSTIYLHSPYGNPEIVYTQMRKKSAIQKIVREAKKTLRDYCRAIAPRTGLKIREIMRFCEKETTLSASRALGLNLVDATWNPEIDLAAFAKQGR